MHRRDLQKKETLHPMLTVLKFRYLFLKKILCFKREKALIFQFILEIDVNITFFSVFQVVFSSVVQILQTCKESSKYIYNFQIWKCHFLNLMHLQIKVMAIILHGLKMIYITFNQGKFLEANNSYPSHYI